MFQMTVEGVERYDLQSAALLNRAHVRVLSTAQERALFLELDHCKRRLLASQQTAYSASAEDGHDVAEIQDFVRDLLRPDSEKTRVDEQLSAIAVRYNEIRNKLAMANLRLVAHVAKKYRNRGISSSDLLQEGFCGLLKAIDRYDCAKETRLATYAVWWIRQSLQRAVAACAYPVRLNPRHLQQLAHSHPEPVSKRQHGRALRSIGAATTIEHIYWATRPTVSLNADFRADAGSAMLNTLTYPAPEEDSRTELDDYVVVMMQQLQPREQVVLQLRFGLGGNECHSLSEVSEVLDVSKERIRQIQEKALEKLRSLTQEKVCCEATG
jgi:RNA polymerase primary sigma factor